MSASFCIRSTRAPLGRLFHVGGNRETWVSQSEPVPFAAMTNRFVDEGGTFPVFKTTSYFFQSVVILETVACAKTVPPSLLLIAAVNGPVKSAPAFA